MRRSCRRWRSGTAGRADRAGVPHLVLAFYLLAVIAGSASLAQTVMIWQRYRKLVIRRYGCFLMSLYLLVLGFLVAQYARVTALSGAAEAGTLLLAGGSLVYIFISPYFFNSLIGRELSRPGRILFFSVDAAVCAAAAVNLAFPRLLPVTLGLIGVLFAMVAYGIVFMAAHMRGIGEQTLRRALVIFLLLSAVFFPLMLIDSLMDSVPFLSIFRFMENLAQPVYFLALNCLSIAFGLRYLNRPAFVERDRLTDYFISSFRITEREAEIIGLLLEGEGTKEIGGRLFISPKTAENHVSHIYQKLGVSSRVQMFQLIRTNSIE
jgi:DNA-binding CsgD family transcriptional regulator